MTIAIFGASGKVGRQVVQTLLAEGHAVRVFVHRHNPFQSHDKLVVIKGRFSDTASVREVINGSDAVISTLGSWHTKQKNILTTGMEAIVPAMEATGAQRIITLTGAGAQWVGDNPTPLEKISHRFLSLVAPKILEDGERHMHLLADSSLAWTTVRSPVMTRQKRRDYQLSMTSPSMFALIPRVAVAQCLCDLVQTSKFERQAPFIRH